MSTIKPLNSDLYRQVDILQADPVITQESNGVWRLYCSQPLEPYEKRITDPLRRGAETYPDRVFVAERCPETDAWIQVTYGEMYKAVQHLGQALLDLNLTAERPLAILSGNDIAHLQLALAAQHVGVPYAPISTAYSLLARSYERLEHVLQVITPGAIYVTDADQYGSAVAAVAAADVHLIAARGRFHRTEKTYRLDDLLATPITDQVASAYEAIKPETIAKFLFTSGSTSMPKAVTSTHQMLCANQQMLAQTFPCFKTTPPILVDWLPWSHTFGGSHNVGIVMFNGGTLYLDDGLPTEAGFARTLRNLKDISPTTYLTVPKGWDVLADALEQDEQLRHTFYKNMQFFYFAGAALSDAVWQKLDRVSAQHSGRAIRMLSGLGMTETSPSSVFTTGPLLGAGYIGLPAPGCSVKLAPVEDKLEIRIKGPHVMPGYWRDSVATAAVFDEEGYYCTGDAVTFYDLKRPELGMVFDGRLAEDFKLSSGTFVSVGPLRNRAILLGAPYIWDVVVCGLNQDEIGLLVFLREAEVQKLVSGVSTPLSLQALCQQPEVKAYFEQFLQRLNEGVSGSSRRVAFLRLMNEAPSLDHHEVTDKGSLNQRAVLTRRAALIEQLYADQDPERMDYVTELVRENP